MAAPSNLPEAVAEAAADALGRAGISRREAAELTGIPITTLQRRLTGRTPFDLDHLAWVAEIAGTTVPALISEAESRLRPLNPGDGTAQPATDGTAAHGAYPESAERTTPRQAS